LRRNGEPKNLAASVRQKLRNRAKQQGEDFQLVLTRYASERLLYRLSKSKHSEAFVLKGAMLFAAWTGQPLRPTRDVDLLGYGEPSAERLAAIFESICRTRVESDGVELDASSVKVAAIREDQEYGGQRITLTARIDRASISVQIDVGFGDVITPGAQEIAYPPLLDFPAPHLRAYTKESVVAEKLHAIVVLGMANSRMKDFHDLWRIAQAFEFDRALLLKAIEATFARRQTEIPEAFPSGLTDEFADYEPHAVQWKAFLARSSIAAADAAPLHDVLRGLCRFTAPVFRAEADRDTKLPGRWAWQTGWK